MGWRLSTFPSVLVRIACARCRRAGCYRLARLAHRFGPETALEDVMKVLVVGCQVRTPAAGRCGARILAPQEDVPIPGRPEIVPRSQRNRRRAYERDGREIEPARIADFLPPRGTGLVSARCQAVGCGHEATVDVTRWRPDIYIPDIGLHLRCSQCGLRGDSHTVPQHLDRGPGGIEPTGG